MAVVANLEVAAGMHLEPGSGHAPATLPESESFRSNWQSVLASMGASSNALGDGSTAALTGRLVQSTQPAARRQESDSSAKLPAVPSAISREQEDRKSAKAPERSTDAGTVQNSSLHLPGVAEMALTAPVVAPAELSARSNSKEDSGPNLLDESADRSSPGFPGGSENSMPTAQCERGLAVE